MRILSTLILSLICSFCSAQQWHIGAIGGISSYNGDLTTSYFPKQGTNGVIGLTASYEVTDKFMIRSGLSHTVLGGADRHSKKDDLRQRNLSFETRLTELNLLGEFYLLNLYDQKLSPYFFGGLAIFRYNPYTFYGGEKIFLQPLGTEGQGIPGYPGKEPYNLTQIAFPIGGGLKIAINDHFRIGIEMGMRVLTTDYLDDVSTVYADENDLRQYRGQRAVDVSYRADEAGGNLNYPSRGAQRGSPVSKDYYYFSTIHITHRINGLFSSKRTPRFGCPVNVF